MSAPAVSTAPRTVRCKCGVTSVRGTPAQLIAQAQRLTLCPCGRRLSFLPKEQRTTSAIVAFLHESDRRG